MRFILLLLLFLLLSSCEKDEIILDRRINSNEQVQNNEFNPNKFVKPKKDENLSQKKRKVKIFRRKKYKDLKS